MPTKLERVHFAPGPVLPSLIHDTGAEDILPVMFEHKLTMRSYGVANRYVRFQPTDPEITVGRPKNSIIPNGSEESVCKSYLCFSGHSNRITYANYKQSTRAKLSSERFQRNASLLSRTFGTTKGSHSLQIAYVDTLLTGIRGIG